jgi:hypothetical protein
MNINPDGTCQVTVVEERSTGLKLIAVLDVIDMIGQYQALKNNSDRTNELFSDMARRLSDIQNGPSLVTGSV